MTHEGFQLWLFDSGQVYTFEQRETEKKNKLVARIQDNSTKYFNYKTLVTVSEDTNCSVVSLYCDIVKESE